jgi:hypothetical protein
MVLKAARHPLSSKAILAAAYRANLVPTHLFGKTQHKTLQARLSVDIVTQKERSLFFRTQPGKFFLRQFLHDPTIPANFRTEVPTRRRVREIRKGPALYLEKQSVEEIFQHSIFAETKPVLDTLKFQKSLYRDPKDAALTKILVWALVYVEKESQVLTYRLGKYREGRDSFIKKRTIGITNLVNNNAMTLFNYWNLGVIDSGIDATKIDLDISNYYTDPFNMAGDVSLDSFMYYNHPGDEKAVVGIIKFVCPDWFEPIKRRLAMNDLEWMDLKNPTNNFDDFDPWSREILIHRHNFFQF